MRNILRRYSWAALLAVCAISAATGAEGFRWDAGTKTLTVTTTRLELTVVGGAIASLKDTLTGDVFSSAGWPEVGQSSTGAVCSLEPAIAKQQGSGDPSIPYRPQLSSPVAFEQLGSREGVVRYRGLTAEGWDAGEGPFSADDELSLSLRLEDGGELEFRMEMRLRNPDWRAEEVHLPLAQLRSPAVILGSGERFARGDVAATSRCVRISSNICSPALAVIEGVHGVLGLWPEPTTYGYDDLTVSHRPDYDEVVPQVYLAEKAQDPEARNEPGVTRSSWWRLAALPTWGDVARRYRADFEKRSGAKPLWEQTPTWVQKIHAVSNERPSTQDPHEAEAFYAQLATRFTPEKLLLFHWNGDCILLFGDHRYMTELQYPTPAEITALRRHGFRWMGYHPYVLIYSPLGMNTHLDEARRRGWGVPEGYIFQPDYAGPPGAAAFYDYFRPVAAGFFSPLEESPEDWILHPGTQLVRDYLVRNVANYCEQHQMSGCYFDTLGADECLQVVDYAPTDRRIMEGNDWRHGEEMACRALKTAHPDLALMSEVESEWTTAYTFYTWEGQTHLTHPVPVQLNHPLRAACWGSYTWTQIDGADEVPLMAGLPTVTLDDDWSVARAKLYMDEELFHDLPDVWDPNALAYFRAKGGRWFQYRRTPWGSAYVETVGDNAAADAAEGRSSVLAEGASAGATAHLKVHLGRLVQQSVFPLPGPARIQHWVAYRKDKPFGLNPAESYEFIMEPPQSDERMWITSLPPATYVSAIRHGTQYSVIELGVTGGAQTGDVEIDFHTTCLQVQDASREWQGPFPKGTVARFNTGMPGALVFVWQEPAKVDMQFTAGLVGMTGHARANGLPYRWWTPNSAIRSVQSAVPGKVAAVPVVEVGTGLHRGWRDQWVYVSPGTNPVLRFDVGGLLSENQGARRPRPLVLSVQVNGRDVWRKRTASGSRWLAQEVPLVAYAGRRVLVTLSAEEEGHSDITPSRSLTPGRFADVRLVDDPLPPKEPSGCGTNGYKELARQSSSRAVAYAGKDGTSDDGLTSTNDPADQ
jgi:hypothetical protein